MAPHFKDRYNEIDIKDIIEDYTLYERSCLDIALDYDCSYGMIRRILLKNNVQLRKAGKQNGKKMLLFK